ncbi:TKL protein kinase [Phytophthora palmivora]|uniref:TKL protein kinase n=1 Tax=Phytophthora palmivora TaxID=4796 RepID=A0A2P4XYX3_9STRA|nr:TKL protein kinase [Phytophthora palmivora]
MPLQRQLDTSTEWAPTGSLRFDGSSSDLALQFYTRSQGGAEVDQLTLTSIPDTVVSRLSDMNVKFDDLDGFAQRAVLWDSGFALTSDNEAKQIWTLNGLSMAEIALTLDEYEATQCTAFKCTQPDGKTAYNNNLCTGTEMLSGVKCVVEEFDMANMGLAMWSIGGETTTIPEIQLVKHTWTDDQDYKVYAVHTMDPTKERSYGACPTTETYGYLNIPCYGFDQNYTASELTVPTPSDWVTSWMKTYSSDLSDSGDTSANSQANDPSASSGGDHNDTNIALLGGAVGGGLCLLLVIILVGLFILARRKRKRSESGDDEEIPKEHIELMSPDPRHSDDRRPTVSTHPRSTLDESLPRSGITLPSSDDSWSNGGTDRNLPHQNHQAGYRPPPYAAQSSHCDGDSRYDRTTVRPPRIQENTRQSAPPQAMSCEKNIPPYGSDVIAPPAYEEALQKCNRVSQALEASAPLSVEKMRDVGSIKALQMLAADPSVNRRRVQFNQLQIERQLPMTTLQTDSFVGHYNGQQVLIKRISPDANVNYSAVEELAFEIQQRAHVKHQYLVEFVGAGWTTAHDLSLVVEFLPLGTLRAYLNRNKSIMSAWTSQKTAIAGGIARGLAYLHRQNPPYIHHEICAKNVVLTDKLEAKLSSCGSIETGIAGPKQKSHQALWIAPEVLNGASYSPAADIYAFGVLLAELDTCETPYFDARSKSGDAMGLTEVLQRVKEGRLRPSFSVNCPEFIRQLGEACCEQEPTERLTAQQISEAAPSELSRKLQGLIGSLVNSVLGGDTTEATTPSPTTTPAPTTRTPTPTTRTPTPTTRTPTPTTRTPAPTTKKPVTKTPQPTTAIPTSSPTPTPTNTPESTSEPSSETSGSLGTEAPETPVPTIETIDTSTNSFSASADADVANSSSGSVDGSFGDWSNGDSEIGSGLASSQEAEVVADTPGTFMFDIVIYSYIHS